MTEGEYATMSAVPLLLAGTLEVLGMDRLVKPALHRVHGNSGSHTSDHIN